jgi:hypothetical protein
MTERLPVTEYWLSRNRKGLETFGLPMAEKPEMLKRG